MKKKPNKKSPFWEGAKKSKSPGKRPPKMDDPPAKKQPGKGKKTPVGGPPINIPNPEEEIRINRFIAQAGVCSRREADALISAGKIKVNGKVVKELGMKVLPVRDTVEYNGKTLRADYFVYILYNKPKNVISTTSDPEGRKTVTDAIEFATQVRVFPVGRLDRNTTGLLLLTNDGELAKKLTHPSHKIRKLYHVRLDKPVTPEDLGKLKKGIELEDGMAKADKIDWVDSEESNEIGIEIHIGRNRIVRRMFEALGYQVTSLDRVMIAHLTKRKLSRGRWRELTQKEVSYLKMM